jgi:carbon monoxide dehydrogenase subunit G
VAPCVSGDANVVLDRINIRGVMLADRNESFIDAAPEQVFAVLADAESYGYWVVGAKTIRYADPTWPQPGSRLHHTLGFGPFTLKDNTKVLIADHPRRLVLEARGRPVGIAHIDFTVTAEGSGSRVQLREWLVEPKVLARFNPLLAPLVRLRNSETLRRLARQVMKSTPAHH